MDKNMLKIVKTCEEKSLAGQTDIDVFDLMYELNLPYDSLKCILDKLVTNRKLVQKDIKTYLLIASTEKMAEDKDEQVLYQEQKDESIHNIVHSDDDEMYETEHDSDVGRRRRVFDMMQAELPEEDEFDDYDDYPGDEDEEDDEDNDDEEYSDPIEELKDWHRIKQYPAESHCKKVIINTLMCDGDEGRRRIQAIKVCIEAGKLTEDIISSRMCVDKLDAWQLYMWIKENGLAYRSIHDIHYKLTITTEQLFEYCCEVNERKATTEKLATVLNNIALKRQSHPELFKPVKAKTINVTQTAESRLKDLIIDEPAMSRSKALIKVKGCLIAANYAKSHDESMVYERMLQMLNEMSDYVYNNLRKKYGGT